MEYSRRQFLKRTMATSLAFGGFQILMRERGWAAGAEAPLGYGELIEDAQGIFDLPMGFSYTVISRAGEKMDDGFFVPGAHDGMAAFPGPGAGQVVLVRNHELGQYPGEQRGAFGPKNELIGQIDLKLLYDAGRGDSPSLGGTTTLLYDARQRKLLGHKLSLVGTMRNCAGGPTPWNTWITCEENLQRAVAAFERDHGYAFEVPANFDAGIAEPTPLRAMGRFYREAVAVDPVTGIVYQTEDLADGLLYRFIPNVKGDLRAGGKLQALKIKDQPGMDTRNWEYAVEHWNADDAGNTETLKQPPPPPEAPRIDAGTRLAVEWIDLEDVEAQEVDLRVRGFNLGAARFARAEGMWHGNESIYWACTSGGVLRAGQIWKYVPSPHEGTPQEASQPGTLELFIEPNDRNQVDMCDNVTVAPWGDLILCEDGSERQCLLGVTPRGEVYRFAMNRLNGSELCGATFSPDGSTLFVNIQTPGLTLAINGPWHNNATAWGMKELSLS